MHIWRQSLVLQRPATIGLLAKREGKQMGNLVSASQERDQRSKINIMEKFCSQTAKFEGFTTTYSDDISIKETTIKLSLSY